MERQSCILFENGFRININIYKIMQLRYGFNNIFKLLGIHSYIKTNFYFQIALGDTDEAVRSLINPGSVDAYKKFKSKTGHFQIDDIKKGEIDRFNEKFFLAYYYLNFAQNSHSLLVKILGMYKVDYVVNDVYFMFYFNPIANLSAQFTLDNKKSSDVSKIIKLIIL